MILGQEKICNRIQSLNLDSFPRSLMLVGPRGSGKHMICKEIADHLHLTSIDITDQLTLEEIEELYNRVEPYLYLIRINEISVKEENTILKFLEEPLKNSFIVLLAETDNGILQTILNRCQTWYLQPYSKDVLKTFLTNENSLILSVADTPGQVQEFSSIDLSDMVALADKIVTKISIAGVANTLTLSGKIAFKDETDKPHIRLFIKVLLHVIVQYCKTSTDMKYIQAYQLTSELNKKLSLKNLDQKLLFEQYLIQLRRLMRGEQV